MSTNLNLQSTILWNVTSCSLLDIYLLLEECTASIFRLKEKAKQVRNKQASQVNNVFKM
jgi:hypothetical protein